MIYALCAAGGFVLGTFFGVFLMALMIVAKEDDERRESSERRET